MSGRNQPLTLVVLALHIALAHHAAIREVKPRATNAPASLAVSTLKSLAKRNQQRRAINSHAAKPRHPAELMRDVRDRFGQTPDRPTKAN